jgi:hypothetical protein
MDFYNLNSDPIISKKRKGTPDDPYRQISESLSIVNGKVTLTETPNRFERVKIVGYPSPLYEIEDGELTDSFYKVDYVEGVVFFNSTFNNKTLTFSYLGEGTQLFPSSRVWLNKTENGDVETLSDKFERVDSDIAAQKSRVDVQISSIPQPSEVLDIRIDRNGNIFSIAKDRIDAEQKKIEDAYQAKNGFNYNSLKERLDSTDDYAESLNSDISVIENNVTTLRNDVGYKSDLNTTDKTSIVNGINSIKSEINSHTGNLNNPHRVTAEQIGAYSRTEIDSTFAKKSQEGWINAVLQNGFTNRATQPVQYYKDQQNRVWFRGGAAANGAGQNTIVLTTPVGYRTNQLLHVAGEYIATDGTIKIGDFIVDVDGTIKISQFNGVGDIFLNNLSFRADQ